MGHGFSAANNAFNSLRSSGRSRTSVRSTRSSRFTTQKSTRQISIRTAEPTGDATKAAQSPQETPQFIPTTQSQPPSDAASPLVRISMDIPRHSMAGHGAFRRDTYEFLLRQLLPKAPEALKCVHAYVGTRATDTPQIFVAPDYVDFVSNRVWPVSLDAFADALWNATTNTPTHAVRKTRVLDAKGTNVTYVEVRIESGHRRNVPVVLNVLHYRHVSPDDVAIVYRTVNEDDEFPIPPQTVHIDLTGWRANEGSSCHEQTFVRYRLPNQGGISRNQWLAGIMQKNFRAEEIELRLLLKLEE